MSLPAQALLAVVLGGLEQAAGGRGDARFALTVRRQHAFWDALAAAAVQGLLPDGRLLLAGAGADATALAEAGGHTPPARAGPCKLFPRFVAGPGAAAYGGGSSTASAASGCSAGGGDGGDSHGGGGDNSLVGSAAGHVTEAGEGHGPRKEFFWLAGEDLMRPPPAAPPAGLQAAEAPRAVGAPGGISGAGGGSSSGAGAQPGPAAGAQEACVGGPLFVQLRSRGTAWFNAALAPRAVSARAYWFAGWLVGQVLPNRAPLAARLASAVFEKLLAGASYQVAEVACNLCTASQMHCAALLAAHMLWWSCLLLAPLGLLACPHSMLPRCFACRSACLAWWQRPPCAATPLTPPQPPSACPPPPPRQPSLEALQRHDPDAAAPLRAALRLPCAQLAAAAALDGAPAGCGGREYAMWAAARLLVEDVAWQFGSFEAGFWAAAPSKQARRSRGSARHVRVAWA